MAPEVEKGTKYDSRVDILSLGLVLYKLTNKNQLPFMDTVQKSMNPSDRAKALRRRLDGEPLPVPCEASQRLAEIILCACAYDPDERFNTAAAMKGALTNLSNGCYDYRQDVLSQTVKVRPTQEQNNPGGTIEVRHPIIKDYPGENGRKKRDYKAVWIGLIAVVCIAVLCGAIRFFPLCLNPDEGDNNQNVENDSGEVQKEADIEQRHQTGVQDQKETAPVRHLLMHDSGVTGALQKGDVAEKVDAVFGNTEYKRDDIESIKFYDSVNGAPDNAWDVSADKTGSVLAWVEGENGLRIAADGGVTLEGDCTGLFAYYLNVKTIDFDSNVNTENVTNMRLWFYHCESLVSIDFDGVDTHNVTSMDRMFANCYRLKVLELGGFDTSKNKDMYALFFHCYELSFIDVSSFETGSVKDMERLCEGCYSLKELDIRSFDTSKVTSGHSMFYQCYALETLQLDPQKFETGNMTTMYAMFARCDNLTSLDVSGFDTSKVKNMAYMFNQDVKLKELDFDVFDMSSVEDKTSMLDGTLWEGQE